ncbi:MAG: hypothetical protein LQ347_000421 [Umbilicaria vellea]|nr:MAG: hypothetical protein LQ347_000421 [Umbilicaria vellea]
MHSSREQSGGDDPIDTIAEAEPSESSTSEYSEPSSEHSGSQPGTRNSRSRPEKRKLLAQGQPKSRAKRLKVFYSDDYRKLFNDTTDEILEGTIVEDRDRLRTSLMGAMDWSSEEKQIFFSALGTRGRDDVRAIAASIGTKSEMEVQVYIQLLNQATLEQHLYERHHQLLGPFDLHGAFEISHDCCEALEQAADALGLLQQKHEEKLEKQKHPELWLLNRSIAEWVDQRLNEDDEGRTEIRQILPAAELLNLKYLLQLSTNVFMNPNEPENNWRSYAERMDTPSILYTGFLDFHNLINSVTKRLVQSSLYFAMSRLRATDSSSYTHKRAVRRRDVTAALNVLGMEANARNFWVGCARRCKLDVYHDVKRSMTEDGKLGYEEVESVLDLNNGTTTDYESSSGEEMEMNARSDKTQHKRPSSPDEAAYHRSDQSSQESGSSSEGSSRVDSTRSILDSSSEHGGTQLQIERDQDNYSEVFDCQASKMEEQRLWSMLGRESTPDIIPEEAELPKQPVIERSTRSDLTEWREWIKYRSEWEKPGPPQASSLYRNRRRGSLASKQIGVIRRDLRDGLGRLDAGYEGSDEDI